MQVITLYLLHCALGTPLVQLRTYIRTYIHYLLCLAYTALRTYAHVPSANKNLAQRALAHFFRVQFLVTNPITPRLFTAAA